MTPHALTAIPIKAAIPIIRAAIPIFGPRRYSSITLFGPRGYRSLVFVEEKFIFPTAGAIFLMLPPWTGPRLSVTDSTEPIKK